MNNKVNNFKQFINENKNENLLLKVSDFIEMITGRFVDKSYIDDGIISYSERVSPNIKSGEKYDELVEKIKKYIHRIKHHIEFKDLIKVEFEYNDECVGFRVELK